MKDWENSEEVVMPLLHRLTSSFFHQIFTLVSSQRRRRLLRPLSWPVTKEAIQYLQSGKAFVTRGLVSFYHRGVCHELSIKSLNPRVGVAVIPDGNNHCNVICMSLSKVGPGELHVKCNVYSSRTQLWWPETEPFCRVRDLNIGLENPVICYDTIYFTGNKPPPDVGSPCIVCLNIKGQRSYYDDLPPIVDENCQFAIARWDHKITALCMISYCSSSKIFSVWLHDGYSEDYRYTKILSVPLHRYRVHKEGKWLKIHQEKFSFDWPGPVECFTILSRGSLLVMAMKDGNIYSYSMIHRSFAMIDESWRP